MKGTKVLVGAFAAAMVAGSVSAGGVLWDNNIVENGFNGRAISPPAFPNIRVADDFRVGEGWVIQDFHWNGAEDTAWTRGDTVTMTIYADNGGQPGAVAASVTGGYTFEDTGRVLFSRPVYNYWMEFDDIRLDAGTYWIGVRHDSGAGTGTNYWLTSDGGPDGAGSSTGFLSTNGGQSWTAEGANWHHAFEITGVIPAPGALALLGLGGLVGVRRRRR